MNEKEKSKKPKSPSKINMADKLKSIKINEEQHQQLKPEKAAVSAAKAVPHKHEAEAAKTYLYDKFYNKLSFFNKLNAKDVLALNIGSEKVHWVVGKISNKETHIRKYGHQKYPVEEKDRWKAMQIALENIKSNVYKPGMQVNVSIFSPEISIRQFILPKISKQKDLQEAIYIKNEYDLKTFDKTAIWNYEILDEFEKEEQKKIRILVASVSGDIVQSYMNIFRNLNLDVNFLAPRPAALLAVYRKMVFRPDKDLLIDIAYNHSQMCFIQNGELEFIRNVGIGARNLEVTIHNPEEQKQEKSASMSIPEDPGAADPQPDMPLRSKLQSKIKSLQSKQNPVLHTFFSEILRSIAFVQGKHTDHFIERIFITGYGLRKESLIPYLKNRLNIPVFVLAPQLQEEEKKTVEYGEYFAAIGTAVQDKPVFNLIPPKYLSGLIFKKLTWLMAVLFIAINGIYGLLSVQKTALIESKQQLIQDYYTEYEQLNPYENDYKKIVEQVNLIQKKNNELQNFIKKHPPLIEVMRLLSQEIPKEIRLNKVHFVKLDSLHTNKFIQNTFKNDYKYQMDIDGAISIEPILADVTLINFMNHLIALRYFKHVELLSKIKDPERGITEFSIRLYK